MTPAEQLNDALRDLIETARTCDLSAADDTVADLTQRITALNAELVPHQVHGVRMQAGLVHDPDATFAGTRGSDDMGDYFRYSPVIGQLNPMSPPASMHVVGNRVEGTVICGARFCGPPGSVHGGVIALILDELLGSACVAADIGGFTGTLSVRYEQTVPLDTPLQLVGWIDRTEGRKTFAKGEIQLTDGTVLSRADGVFIRPASPPSSAAS